MEMSDAILNDLNQIEISLKDIKSALSETQKYDPKILSDISACIWELKRSVGKDLWHPYSEFFNKFGYVCSKAELSENNYDVICSSLDLAIECIGEMRGFAGSLKRCACCQKRVIYRPLPSFYEENKKKYGGSLDSRSETLNKKEYICPECLSADRDRMIVSFLLKDGLPFAPYGTRVLQIAPSPAIDFWINYYCEQVSYESTDLYMQGVSFKSDIQDMNAVPDNTYDYVICSHVLEHVRDDVKALQELRRILKYKGKVVFLVPVNLNQDEIDEEWGLSEAENWRRFGQGDHCRCYSKKGLLERLESVFTVHQLGKDFFGEETFRECGLTDTSTLYILEKNL
ncbi:Methyltransferase domain-containing protein [Lachnospiraceae bacterium]|nr:Methyltransferase domain-containing protein [Lachnospiraceae bacterium]